MQADTNGDSSGISTAHRFGLMTLQREAGSSAQATRETLVSLAKVKGLESLRPTFQNLVKRAAAITTSAKAAALQKILAAQARADDGKVIVFTHFRATLDMLAQHLAAWGIDFVRYHGGLSLTEKEQAIRRFERESSVLLSTEAAGEGRNLQFCRVMVNFDLPWNPMRIEQRVGRIHRVGQDRPVDIFNLSAKDTIEDYILDILDRKLNMFELVIGEVEMILGQLAEERDFEEIVFEVWAQSHTPGELQTNMETLGNSLMEAHHRYQKIKAYDEALFGEDFSTE
jgi:SNF2 family DNA or RNA helicase